MKQGYCKHNMPRQQCAYCRDNPAAGKTIRKKSMGPNRKKKPYQPRGPRRYTYQHQLDLLYGLPRDKAMLLREMAEDLELLPAQMVVRYFGLDGRPKWSPAKIAEEWGLHQRTVTTLINACLHFLAPEHEVSQAGRKRAERLKRELEEARK